jgi:hypothetical protein
MAAERVDIGFVGGQVLSVRLDENALKELRKSLERDTGWHDLDADDGQVALDLAKVAYMKIDSGEHKVGFITES